MRVLAVKDQRTFRGGHYQRDGIAIPNGEVAMTGGVVRIAEGPKIEESGGALWRAIPKEEAAATEEAALSEGAARSGEKRRFQ